MLMMLACQYQIKASRVDFRFSKTCIQLSLNDALPGKAVVGIPRWAESVDGRVIVLTYGPSQNQGQAMCEENLEVLE